MNMTIPSSRRAAQQGGITILVALMLLVLLTISVVGLSRNTIRETIITGTARQGLEVRDVADSGIAWGVFWLSNDNSPQTSSTGATLFNSSLQNTVRDMTLRGKYQSISGSGNPDMSLISATGDSQYFDINLMSMGKMPVVKISQNAVSTYQSDDARLPDLYGVRSTAHYLQGGVVEFVHSKESWISTPPHFVSID